jgi:DNA repair exonuclease SbcCD ATPase subunit
MFFGKLDVAGFLSIENASLRLDTNGLNLVTGTNHDAKSSPSNGSGKSAIFDALVWALYGRTIRGVQGDDVINKFLTSGCQVQVEIHDGDIVYCVRRTRNNQKLGNSLNIFVGSDDVSGPTTIESQKKINDLIGLDYETFTSSIVFGRDTLRFAQATDKEQKVILEKLLGTEVFERAGKLANQVLSDLSRQDHELSSELKTLTTNKEDLTRKRQIALDAFNSHEKEKARILHNITKEINELNVTLEFKQKEKSLLVEEANSTEEGADNVKEKLESRIQRERDNIDLHNKDLRKESSLLEVERRLAQQAQKQIDKYNNSGDVCGSCEQAIDKTHKASLIASAEKEVGSRRAQASKHTLAIEGIEKTIGDCNDKIEKYKSSLQTIQNCERLAREAQRKVAAVEGVILGIEKNLSSLTSRHHVVESSRNEFGEAVSVYDAEIEEKEGKIADSQDKLDKVIAETAYISFWSEGFSTKGLRSYLLDSVAPFLTERANRYSSVLTDGSVKIEFNTTSVTKSGELRDKMEVKAVNRHGASIYEGCSSGERQRIDLAVALSLTDLAANRGGRPIKLAVFDEMFEHLDAGGCEKAVELLQREYAHDRSIFVLTHLEDLKQLFPRVIEIEKRGGLSHLVMDTKNEKDITPTKKKRTKKPDAINKGI